MDGFYSICDFITDIIALVSAKISNRRANKKYPFGYGKIEYISQMIIGFLIFGLGIFTTIRCFKLKFVVPNLKVIYLVILVILLKTLSSNYLFQVGKKNRSQILISSAKESFIDVLSSTIVLFIVLIGQVFPLIDLIGSLFISIVILFFGLKIILDNILALIGEDSNDAEIKKMIEEIVNSYRDIIYSDASLIKSGPYYQATIEIAVDDNMAVKTLIKKGNGIRNKLKRSKYNIKFIDFNFISK